MNAIYLENSYLKDFDATVIKASGERIVLDKTGFYPVSGGQPSDLGSIVRDDEEFKVLQVEPAQDGIVHILDRAGL
ncbi:MAG: alanyl-tRNA editing protein AlaX, partial [Methanothrix sp.]